MPQNKMVLTFMQGFCALAFVACCFVRMHNMQQPDAGAANVHFYQRLDDGVQPAARFRKGSGHFCVQRIFGATGPGWRVRIEKGLRA